MRARALAGPGAGRRGCRTRCRGEEGTRLAGDGGDHQWQPSALPAAGAQLVQQVFRRPVGHAHAVTGVEDQQADVVVTGPRVTEQQAAP
ncbi:hypothetical protein LUX57_48830 [Actinomadura madurae]|uniref:hypothetical protein n=1 Tax=Actinomadura madurae TaxID=1993 RepID=UPI0020D235E0|nr:hypothetical protein [Actinomadura madurae]MCP9972023.1 hypothetical protein [Actinomadura madurae]